VGLFNAGARTDRPMVVHDKVVTAANGITAVRLLGLPLPPWRPDPLACITRRGPAPTNDPLLGDVHVVDYDDADVVDVAGVPVLAGARLVLDCCEVLAPDSALAVADAALGRELTTPAALRTALRRRCTRLRAADLIAEKVVERADPLAENWFESSSRWWLLEAGLPRPRLQVAFTDGRGAAPGWTCSSTAWWARPTAPASTTSPARSSPRSSAKTGCATSTGSKSSAGCRRRCAHVGGVPRSRRGSPALRPG